MIVGAISFDVAQYTTQYELLRSQVVGTRSDPSTAAPLRGVGLALLLREGIPGWLKAVEGVIRASEALSPGDSAPSPPSEPAAGNESSPPWLAAVPRQHLTTLLASLVLSTRCSPREGYPSCQ